VVNARLKSGGASNFFGEKLMPGKANAEGSPLAGRTTRMLHTETLASEITLYFQCLIARFGQFFPGHQRNCSTIEITRCGRLSTRRSGIPI
jgi:hypothetical protein